MGRAVAAVRQRTLGSQPQLGDHVQALWTGYKSVTRPDQQLLDRLPSALFLYMLFGWLPEPEDISVAHGLLLFVPGRCSIPGTCICVAIVQADTRLCVSVSERCGAVQIHSHTL